MQKKGETFTCQLCPQKFYRKAFQIKNGRYKFCSNKCRLTALNSGKEPWNKGTKGVVKPNSGSFKKGVRASPATEFKARTIKFKGSLAEYKALHHWVANKLGRPNLCSHCGTTEERRYHWANKSGKYIKDINDWIRLCVPCHTKYDDRKPKNVK